ncbi:MAG: hypothetical protein MUF58_15780 [Arcicella sp.]|jgi:hypothetical protein|nr:hypothetical protein [Arcicella sp.]
MKKILLSFSESLISREQMRKIKGGYEEEYGCKKCKDDSSYLCSIAFGGGCECNVTGLSKECGVIA